MPTPDKIRPLVTMRCTFDGCEFSTTQEWAGYRHEEETGHRMDWWAPKARPRYFTCPNCGQSGSSPVSTTPGGTRVVHCDGCGRDVSLAVLR
jgi:hypothetical protein